MRGAAALVLCLIALAGCGDDDGGAAARTGTVSTTDCERQFAELKRQAERHPDAVSPAGRKALDAAGSGGGVLCANDVDVLTQQQTTP